MNKKLSEWTIDEMESLYIQLGSFRKCAKELCCDPKTFRKYYYNKKNEINNHDANMLCNDINNTLNNILKPITNNSITPDLDSAIQTIQNAGWFVTKKPLQRNYTFDLDIEPTETNIYKVGIVSDTHLGSKYQQMESLWKFYEKCEREGITTIFHAGDLSDGVNMYNGQQFEIFLHGERAQAQYIIENYPKIDGITTEMIGGNHDESFYKRYGSDICYDVSIQRPDMKYKGFYLANFNIGNINICIHHGDGGVAYARSYKPQKLALSKIENKDTPTPNILAIGHYHATCILPDYVGIYTIQMPAFQSSTPSYMGRKGLNPDIGGIILEFEESEGKLVSTKTQYVNYRTVENDY